MRGAGRLIAASDGHWTEAMRHPLATILQATIDEAMEDIRADAPADSTSNIKPGDVVELPNGRWCNVESVSDLGARLRERCCMSPVAMAYPIDVLRLVSQDELAQGHHDAADTIQPGDVVMLASGGVWWTVAAVRGETDDLGQIADLIREEYGKFRADAARCVLLRKVEPEPPAPSANEEVRRDLEELSREWLNAWDRGQLKEEHADMATRLRLWMDSQEVTR